MRLADDVLRDPDLHREVLDQRPTKDLPLVRLDRRRLFLESVFIGLFINFER